MGSAWLLAAEMPFSTAGQYSRTRSPPILQEERPRQPMAADEDNGLPEDPGPC